MYPAPAYQLDAVQGNKNQQNQQDNGDPSEVTLPRDDIIWSICSLVYWNPFCLGLAALYYSIKSRDMKVVGDVETARTYGSTARKLNIAALTLIIIGVIIIISVYATIATHAKNFSTKLRSP